MAKWFSVVAALTVAAAILAASPPSLPQQVLSLFTGYPDSERLQCRPFLPSQIFLDYPPQEDDPAIQAAVRKLRRLLDNHERGGSFETIAVAITTPDGPIFVDTRGKLHSNETNSELVMPNSQYRIASVSKLTPVFIGWLFQQKGTISWDDRVQEYLPGLPEYWEDMTLYDLATHMSGLGRDWPPGTISDWPYSIEGGGAPPYNGLDMPTVEELLQSISDNTAVTPPWSEPTYSDTGAGLLGIVLLKAAERHYGSQAPTSFAALARQMIFEPLSMDDSHYLATEDNKDQVVVPSFMTEMTYEDLTDTMNGAGGQFSSLNDLVKFAQFLLDPVRKDGLLKQKTVNRWLKPIVSFEEDDLTELGMMWEILKHPDGNQRLRHVYQKLGLMLAFGSCFSLQPGSGYGIIVLMTGTFPDAGGVCWEALHIVQPAIDEILAERATKLYVGEWSSEDGMTNATVSLHKGTLFIDRLEYKKVDVLKAFPVVGRLALRSTQRKDEFRIDTGFPGGFNGKPHLGCYVYWNGKDDWGMKNGYSVNVLLFEGAMEDRTLKIPSLGVTLYR